MKQMWSQTFLLCLTTDSPWNQLPEHEWISPLEQCFLGSQLASKDLAARRYLCCQAKPCHAVWWDRLLSKQPEMGLFSLNYCASLQTHWLCQSLSYTALHTGSYFPSRPTPSLHPHPLPIRRGKPMFAPSFPSIKLCLDCRCPVEKVEWLLEETGCSVNKMGRPTLEFIWLVWPLADSLKYISPSLLCVPAKWALLHCVPDLFWH